MIAKIVYFFAKWLNGTQSWQLSRKLYEEFED